MPTTMKVINIHKRILNQPKAKIADLLETLATKQDRIMPTDKWPAMKLDKGLQVGSKGGHGPIRYTVGQYTPGTSIQFEFTSPKGFNGHHRFEITELEPDKTELRHTIDMKTSGTGILKWALAVRWLHDALLEDAFDKVENHFSTEKKSTKWNAWVRILRKMAARNTRAKKATRLLLLLACCFFCATPKALAQKEAKAFEQIEKILYQQQQDWNAGNIGAFMEAYWKAEELQFGGANGITRGWQQTLDNYKIRYPDRAAMGQLTFEIKDMSMHSPRVVSLTGSWELERAQDRPGGHFLLIWRKIKGEWKIVIDHTSSKQ